MQQYTDIINEDIINDILKIKQEQDNGTKQSSLIIGNKSSNREEMINELQSGKKYYPLIIELLNNYDLQDVKKIYALYYFGRGLEDGSVSISTSFSDVFKFHNSESLDDIALKFYGSHYSAMIRFFKTAKEQFNEHESNVEKAKECFDKRIKSYTKKGESTFFKLPKNANKKSTNQAIKDVFETFSTVKTNDIFMANDILSKIIHETNGQLVVDFLGSENFDHLDYIENDDEILKIYWKYSNGNNKDPHPPHNIRIDIAFEELELIQYSDTNVAIALKGFYRNKKEIKNYYCNKEKISKTYFMNEDKNSLFHHDLNFDKKQRGGLENFSVTFLPWRYYNILILPKENIPSVYATTRLLILKNLIDIEASLNKTFDEFQTNFIEDEDYITMYGNRQRKIVEKLLKFILLAAQIMFKENYEKDMLGNLLEQLKNESEKQDNHSLYDRTKLKEIIDILEEQGLLDKLNLCSHDNVKHKIDKDIVYKIYTDITLLLQKSFEYFQLKY